MTRPHGQRAKYVVEKCRCFLCRRANAAYQTQRNNSPNTWASPAQRRRVQRHVRNLRNSGHGIVQIAVLSDSSSSLIREIATGINSNKARPHARMKRLTARRILAVQLCDHSPGARVPAGPTVKRLDELLQHGFTKSGIARLLGRGTEKTAATLQLRTTTVTYANEVAVEALHHDLMEWVREEGSASGHVAARKGAGGTRAAAYHVQGETG